MDWERRSRENTYLLLSSRQMLARQQYVQGSLVFSLAPLDFLQKA